VQPQDGVVSSGMSLPREGTGQGHPVRDLRRGGEHWLGQRGHRS
jgi:hypothetical protein